MTSEIAAAGSANYSQTAIDDYLEKLQHQTTKDLIPAMAFLGGIALVGLIGNSLVLFVYTRKFPASPVRVFLVVVAAFDLITNAIVIPGEIYDLLHSWCFDKPHVCQVRLFFTISTTMASALLLLALAVTRYRKICHPFKKQVSINQSKVICSLVVVIAHLLAAPYAVIHGRQKKRTEVEGIYGYFCAVDDDYVGTIWPKLNSALFVFLFVSCCTPLIVLYVLIWSKARKHTAKRINQSMAIRTQDTELSNRMWSSATSTDDTFSSSDAGAKNSPIGDSMTQTKDAIEPQSQGLTHEGEIPNEVVSKCACKPLGVTNTFHRPHAEAQLLVETPELTEHAMLSPSKNEESDKSNENQSPNDIDQNDTSRTSSYVPFAGLWKRASVIQKETTSRARLRGMGRTSCMLLTISVSFIVGFLPFLALESYKSADPAVFASVSGFASSMYHLFLRFCLINSCINPIVYNVFDLKFRAEVLKLLGCAR